MKKIIFPQKSVPLSPDFLKNQHIFITGAGAGIGAEIARTYAGYGAKLILIGKTSSKLAQVAADIQSISGQQSIVMPVDLATLTEQQSRDIVSALQAAGILTLHGVLHNAAVLGEIGPLIEQNAQSWQKVMQVNVNAAFLLTKALLPLLLNAKNRSTLIFTTSSVGHRARAGWGAYAVSKFATEGLMQLLAAEYENRLLRINAVDPGGTATAMRATAFPQEDPAQLPTPAEIMPLYCYLMSAESQHIHGQVLSARQFSWPIRCSLPFSLE